MGDARIIVEPAARNTAPAIALAALAAVADDPAAMLLVMPADHVMTDVAAFLDAIEAARPAGVAGALATFGITPSHPETGYGYIAAGEKRLRAEPASPRQAWRRSAGRPRSRSEEHTSELQSLMRISYAVFC